MIETTCSALRTLAANQPRIHCLTNAVAMRYTAAMLLTVGAQPTMTFTMPEVTDFVEQSKALLINLGTLDGTRRQAIEAALKVAQQVRIPWVLDPVLVDASLERRRYARQLLLHQPTVIRGNTLEIAALAGQSMEHAAFYLAQDVKTVVAQTGRVDVITDSQRRITIHNGHSWMARVPGMGCAESALIAAFLAITGDALLAAAGAIGSLNIAGEQAAATSAGPGSFQWAILDYLYHLDEATLRAQSRCQVWS